MNQNFKKILRVLLRAAIAAVVLIVLSFTGGFVAGMFYVGLLLLTLVLFLIGRKVHRKYLLSHWSGAEFSITFSLTIVISLALLLKFADQLWTLFLSGYGYILEYVRLWRG